MLVHHDLFRICMYLITSAQYHTPLTFSLPYPHLSYSSTHDARRTLFSDPIPIPLHPILFVVRWIVQTVHDL